MAAVPPTDKEIRIAIAEVIRTALTSLYTVNPANVYDHWILSHALGESAALLRPDSGVSKGKVHTWMIGLAGIDRERPDKRDNRGSLRKVGPNRRDIVRNYRIWAYYDLDSGTDGSESENNSENNITLELEKVSDAFSLAPILGIDNEWLQGHDELQFHLIDTFEFGETICHVAQGKLAVHLYKPIA